jgi:ankyrin repeat protein
MANRQEVHSAVASDDVARLREYVENRPESIQERDRDGCTPLLVAARDGRLEAVKILVELGAEIEARDPIYLRTPLAWASFHAHPEVAEFLLRSGADVNAADAYGNTPLKTATMGREGAWDEWVPYSSHEYEALVDLLRNHGATERHDLKGE